MKKFSCYFVIQAIVSAAMSFALIACGDDSSSASNDDTPVSSSEKDETLSSSSEKSLEGRWTEYEIGFCNDYNPNPEIGDACEVARTTGSGRFQHTTLECYRYEEDGWSYVNRPSAYGLSDRPCKELVAFTAKCSPEKEGYRDSLVDGWHVSTYECTEGAWKILSYVDSVNYYCNENGDGEKCLLIRDGKKSYYKNIGDASNTAWLLTDSISYYCAGRDTCSFEEDSVTKYYRLYLDGYYQWEHYASSKPGLGLCTQDSVMEKAVQKDGENYYCYKNTWTLLPPRQYTDPRKEGLTDAEYDVLDLPKDAKVGDRAEGLLEECWYGKELSVIKPRENYMFMAAYDSYLNEAYDYCLPVNYYRYSEDGSWTLETEDELFEAVYDAEEVPCSSETIGTTYVSVPYRDNPRKIMQCINNSGVYSYEVIEYIFDRPEKK